MLTAPYPITPTREHSALWEELVVQAEEAQYAPESCEVDDDLLTFEEEE